MIQLRFFLSPLTDYNSIAEELDGLADFSCEDGSFLVVDVADEHTAAMVQKIAAKYELEVMKDGDK